MLKVVLKIALFCFIAGMLPGFEPSSADAASKVYRKTMEQEVVAELFVTSW